MDRELSSCCSRRRLAPPLPSTICDRQPDTAQTWKTFESATMDRLREKGWISQPRSKASSVRVTPAGVKKAEELFRKYFQQ